MNKNFLFDFCTNKDNFGETLKYYYKLMITTIVYSMHCKICKIRISYRTFYVILCVKYVHLFFFIYACR